MMVMMMMMMICIYKYKYKYKYYIYICLYLYIDEWCVYMPKKHMIYYHLVSMVSTEADGLAETNHKSSGIIR